MLFSLLAAGLWASGPTLQPPATAPQYPAAQRAALLRAGAPDQPSPPFAHRVARPRSDQDSWLSSASGGQYWLPVLLLLAIVGYYCHSRLRRPLGRGSRMPTHHGPGARGSYSHGGGYSQGYAAVPNGSARSIGNGY